MSVGGNNAVNYGQKAITLSFSPFVCVHFYCAALAINRQIQRATTINMRGCSICSCCVFYAQRLPLNYWWFICSRCPHCCCCCVSHSSVTQLPTLIRVSREKDREGEREKGADRTKEEVTRAFTCGS